MGKWTVIEFPKASVENKEHYAVILAGGDGSRLNPDCALEVCSKKLNEMVKIPKTFATD